MTSRTRRPATADVAVEVLDRQRALRFDCDWLARVVRRATARLRARSGELCILVVDDRRIASLHKRWLGIAGPTDVITFDLADDGPRDGLHGDIVVSAETARRTARDLGWAPRHELAYYVIHGLLHLAGYDDHAAADRRRMRARERSLMAAVGLPRPPRPRRKQP